jgi:hypothetical protein
MSDDKEPELRPIHVLAAHRQSSLRLGQESRVLPFREDTLYGVRSIKKPLISITVKKDPGPIRHALSQMVVAGTMTVHQSPAGMPLPSPGSQPRVFTFTPPPLVEKSEEKSVRSTPKVLPAAPKTAPPPQVERTVVFDFNAPSTVPNLPED